MRRNKTLAQIHEWEVELQLAKAQLVTLEQRVEETVRRVERAERALEAAKARYARSAPEGGAVT